MAITNFDSVATVVSHVLHKTIKDEIRRRFIEMLNKDIEPMLEQYTKEIVASVSEMRDPTSWSDIKLNVQFKLPDTPKGY